jgi:hypothetical protein
MLPDEVENDADTGRSLAVLTHASPLL